MKYDMVDKCFCCHDDNEVLSVVKRLLYIIENIVWKEVYTLEYIPCQSKGLTCMKVIHGMITDRFHISNLDGNVFATICIIPDGCNYAIDVGFPLICDTKEQANKLLRDFKKLGRDGLHIDIPDNLLLD